MIERAVALARPRADPHLLAAALAARCSARWGPDGMDVIAGDVGEILALAEASGDRVLMLRGQYWQILSLLARGELLAADAAIAGFGRLAEDLRDPLARWQAATLRVVHPQLEGRFAEAEALATEAWALGEQVNRSNAEEVFRQQVTKGATLPDGLTDREAEVLRLIAAGTSNRAIAVALVLSVRTVERHIANLYPKIGAHNRADAAAYAIRRGLA